MKTTFTGFSTVASTQKRSFKLHDVELVKCDLLNHFHTRIGERVLRPNYGCRIWDYLMEPFTENIRDLVIEDATRIVAAEPRVSLVQVFATAYSSGLRVELLLDYVSFNKVDTFIVDFENRQSIEGF